MVETGGLFMADVVLVQTQNRQLRMYMFANFVHTGTGTMHDVIPAMEDREISTSHLLPINIL